MKIQIEKLHNIRTDTEFYLGLGFIYEDIDINYSYGIDDYGFFIKGTLEDIQVYDL